MITPKKSLGQNFLLDKNIIKKITELTNIKNENIIEVGPGYGALTDEIIKLKPKKLIIIEKDYELYLILKKKYKKSKITILNKDVFNFNFNELVNSKIISNLPYNISSKFILKTIVLNNNIKEMICMIQKELADKFDSKKGKMNKYKFISNYCTEYQINFTVSPKVFYPKPRVYSKVVKFLIKKQNFNLNKLEYFMKNFFINKRKKIKSNKKFSNLINKKYLNYRFEDLNYQEVLEIYETTNFSFG